MIADFMNATAVFLLLCSQQMFILEPFRRYGSQLLLLLEDCAGISTDAAIPHHVSCRDHFLNAIRKIKVFFAMQSLFFRSVCNLFLKDTEGLLSRDDTLGFVCHNVESDRLAERTALSTSDNISFFDRESGRAVHRNVLVAFLETTVLLDVVKVIPSDNDSSLHLCGDDKSLQDATTDGNIAGEGALFVDVISFNSGSRSFDSETNRLDEAHGLGFVSTHGTFAGDKDSILLLVSLFVLIALDVFLWDADHFEL